MIKIREISVYEIFLPFAVEFSHAKSKKDYSKNIIVEARTSDNKIIGYGEGAPRFYAYERAEESNAKKVIKFITNDFFPWHLEDVSSVWEFTDSLPDETNTNPLVCAIEMALLDAIGKSEGKYLIDYFPKDFMTESINYGATIPITNNQRVRKFASLLKEMGINNLRLKMDVNTVKNMEALKAVRDVYQDGGEIRIDPNGSWDRSLAFLHLDMIKGSQVKIVEEPIMNDKEGLKDFSDKLKEFGIITMACQSAGTFKEVEKIARERIYGMVNIKLSRSGGFRRSLKIIDFLRKEKVSFQIGCNRGESGILSSAGRILGLLSRDAMYYDGSYDSFLLKENTTVEDVSFGYAGIAGPLKGHGLGVNADLERLMRLCDYSTKIRVTKD